MAITTTNSFEAVLAEFQANPLAAFPQNLSNVAGLAGGGYAFICASDGTGAATDNVQIALYGTPNDSQPTFTRLTGADVQGEPVVTRLSNGTVAFAWKEGAGGKNGIVVTVIDPDTNRVLLSEQKSPGSRVEDVDPEVTALTDGNFALAFTDTRTEAVQFQVVSPAGNAVGLIVQVAAGGTDAAIAQLSGGRIAVTYTRGGDVKAKLFEANGTPVAGLGEITVSSGNAGSAQIAALKNGGFAVVFDDESLNGTPGVAMKLYDAEGTNQTSGDTIFFDADSGRQEQDPEVTVLDNGFILATYSDQITPSDHDIKGRLFDQNGTAIEVDGTIDLVFDGGLGQQTQSSVAGLKGGQFVVTDTDDNPGDGSGSRISGRVQELVRNRTGDGANDQIAGDELRDIIRGGGGGDTIAGFGGRDDLFGDAGNDFVQVTADDIVTGATYDGGVDDDVLGVFGTGATTFDFRQCTVANLEQLTFFNQFGGGATVFLTASQFKSFDTVFFEQPQIGARVVSIDMGDEIRLDLPKITIAGAPSVGDGFVVNGDGDDETIVGSAITDTIFGGGGADRLDGRGGADIMTGGAGNDLFFVDDFRDRVLDAPGGGTADRILASESYKLLAGQEIEFLTTTSVVDTSAIRLTGNEKAQTLVGNAGANVLDGKGGVDTLRGLGGKDTYLVDKAGDVVIEAARGGTDRVAASVTYTLAKGQEIEAFSTTSAIGKAAIKLTGNETNQTITGNNGSNYIDGKEGTDQLRGNAGKDSFLFTTKLGSTNVDRILDFSSADDTIRLENAIFKALAKTGTLSSAAFKDLGVADAHVDADDRILYNSKTGVLSYDADGFGASAATVFAKIDKHPTLTFEDFVVI